MRWWHVTLPPLDWRQPWCWPRPFQILGFVGAGVVGVVGASPWWLASWQAWCDAQEAQTQLTAEQVRVQTMTAETSLWMRSQNPSGIELVDVTALTQMAHQQGLQLSQFDVAQPQQNPVLNALQIQQVPVHLTLQGAWSSWLNWLAQWPTAAPGMSVASLEIKAHPSQGISAHVVAMAPRFAMPAFGGAWPNDGLPTDTLVDPFSGTDWIRVQRAHAQQHPSYAELVAPELLRPRDPLEAFARERLQYVGQIASNEEVQALVNVLPVDEPTNARMMRVYRVRVGNHLGQNFGTVVAVQPEQLVVKELALDASGKWQWHEVHLPLREVSP